MEFTNKFHVPLPLEEAWKLMLDVPRIMPCLPGARLTGVVDGNRYNGSVSVKLGPVKLSFDGQAEMIRTDEAAHIAYLKGSGLDPKGRGSAQSEFSFALAPAEGGTEVTVHTQLQLSGAVAQYGRGSGMISEVAGHILKQFEENLADSLQEVGGAVAQAAPTIMPPRPASFPTDLGQTGGTAQAPAAAPSQFAPGGGSAAQPGSLDAQTMLYQSQVLLAQSQAVLASTQQLLAEFKVASVAAKKKKPKELNMLSIGMRAMWSSMFGRKG